MTRDLSRIVIVGPTNAGKSTLALRLGTLLDLSVVDLDDLNWLPGWRERDHDDFRQRVDRATAVPRWVVAGNYTRVRDLTWGRATFLVWLDPAFAPTFVRALRRTLRRGLLGERCCNGNRESLVKAFFTRESILWWSIKTHGLVGKRVLAALASDEWRRLAHARLHSPQEVETFVAAVAPD